MQLEAMIVRTWRPELCESRDTLGGRDEVSPAMDLDAEIKGVWRCTWRP